MTYNGIYRQIEKNAYGFYRVRTNFSILVVDDNEDNIFTLKRHLEKDGFNNLSFANDGFEALSIINAKSISLVLLDLMMPGMSGYEVLDAVKDKIIAQQLMVLMISSADQLENITECIKLGAEDFLPKPFNRQLLKARIGACIEKYWHIYKESIYRTQIEAEKAKYLTVLNEVFPRAIVREMMETNTVKPKLISNVAVLFADIVSFTEDTEKVHPERLLQDLELFIKQCESVASKYKIEKIKTIGDSFMAAAGMLEDVSLPVLACVCWASEMLQNLQTMPMQWFMRIGMAVGDIICGIVGNREYLFDVWGRSVNTAARVQAIADPNTIYMTKEAWLKLKDCDCKGKLVGKFNLKGIKQATTVYQVELLTPTQLITLN